MALTVIIAFTVLFLFGFPVVLAITVPAIIYVIWADFPPELIAQRMTYALDSFPLVAVPVFIFVGSLMNQSGITTDIYGSPTPCPGACLEGSRRSTSSGR